MARYHRISRLLTVGRTPKHRRRPVKPTPKPVSKQYRKQILSVLTPMKHNLYWFAKLLLHRRVEMILWASVLEALKTNSSVHVSGNVEKIRRRRPIDEDRAWGIRSKTTYTKRGEHPLRKLKEREEKLAETDRQYWHRLIDTVERALPWLARALAALAFHEDMLDEFSDKGERHQYDMNQSNKSFAEKPPGIRKFMKSTFKDNPEAGHRIFDDWSQAYLVGTSEDTMMPLKIHDRKTEMLVGALEKRLGALMAPSDNQWLTSMREGEKGSGLNFTDAVSSLVRAFEAIIKHEEELLEEAEEIGTEPDFAHAASSREAAVKKQRTKEQWRKHSEWLKRLKKIDFTPLSEEVHRERKHYKRDNKGRFVR